MPEIKPEQLLLIAGFILPGAISMYVYGLKVPQKEFQLKDRIAEAVCFSMLNFVMVWVPVEQVLTTGTVRERPVAGWVILTLGFVVAPVAWPLLLVQILHFAATRGWIAVRAKTAWDEFFGRQRTECWVQIELTDGRVFGGRYGRSSYASSWPDPGHIYVEELWRVDDEGYFVDPVPGRAGLLLRPGDYKLLRVFEGGPADE
jgi:hypothetical protein